MSTDEKIDNLQRQILQIVRAVLELRSAVLDTAAVTQAPVTVHNSLDEVGRAVDRLLNIAEGKDENG